METVESRMIREMNERTKERKTIATNKIKKVTKAIDKEMKLAYNRLIEKKGCE